MNPPSFTEVQQVCVARGWRCSTHIAMDLEQVYLQDNNGYYIERITGPNSRRKKWVVVDRKIDGGNHTKYPEPVAGPFDDLEGAMVAYKLLASTD